MDALYRFQAINDCDLPLLATIYASSRQDELALSNWPEEQRTLFLQQQFKCQHQHYMQAYPIANYDLIYYQDQVVGRLYVDRRPESIHIIDITLLPQFRNQGLGTEIISSLFSEARSRDKGRLVSLSVEKMNSAGSLYQRLGFEVVRDEGVYIRMARQL